MCVSNLRHLTTFEWRVCMSWSLGQIVEVLTALPSSLTSLDILDCDIIGTEEKKKEEKER